MTLVSYFFKNCLVIAPELESALVFPRCRFSRSTKRSQGTSWYDWRWRIHVSSNGIRHNLIFFGFCKRPFRMMLEKLSLEATHMGFIFYFFIFMREVIVEFCWFVEILEVMSL